MRSIRPAALAAATLACAACNAAAPIDPGPGGNTGVASVTVVPIGGTTPLAFDALGVTADLAASVRNASGQLLTDVPLTWSVRHTGVISVSQAGTVTAIGNGVDTVVARAGTVSGLLEVRVTQVPVSLQVTNEPAAFSIVGTMVALTAQVRDRNDRAISGAAATVTWTSSNPQALPVDANGLLVAAGPGTSTIRASVGALTDQFTVTVAISGPVGPPITGGAVPCTGGFAGPFPCSNVTLLAYLPPGALGVGNTVRFNDIWGWTDPQTGKEYALVGRRDGVAFVDVSTPTNPVYLGQLPKTNVSPNSTWRDMKVHANHMFVVADGAGAHGMQVFDLTQLRTVTVPRTFAPLTTYTRVNSVHNIVINEQTGFAYLVGASSGGTTCGGGLHMVNIQNPANPTFAGCFADPMTGRAGTGYTHDAQCVTYTGPDAAHAGKEICFGSNETHLSIANVTVKAAPVALSRASYPAASYTHQGWLSTDQRHFFINDELDETGGATAFTRTLVWDVSDLDDPVLVKQYLGPTPASDHNHYVVGTRMWASNYQYGIRVINVSAPTNPVQLGFFDTAPQFANTPGFNGSWSNYPFFASGIVVVSSIDEGMFVLRLP